MLARPALNELYLIGVSYVIMATFLTLELSLSVALSPVWATMFFVYVTYSLLPIRLQEAVAAGVILALAHILCTAYTTTSHTGYWQEVSAYLIMLFTLALLCVLGATKLEVRISILLSDNFRQ